MVDWPSSPVAPIKIVCMQQPKKAKGAKWIQNVIHHRQKPFPIISKTTSFTMAWLETFSFFEGFAESRIAEPVHCFIFYFMRSSSTKYIHSVRTTQPNYQDKMQIRREFRIGALFMLSHKINMAYNMYCRYMLYTYSYSIHTPRLFFSVSFTSHQSCHPRCYRFQPIHQYIWWNGEQKLSCGWKWIDER